ncbi:MAG: ethanolamine ammonia-lyase reactivating factor EutA [Bacillota bacterium]
MGIDIGTTTTQLVISRLTIKNIAPGTAVPRMEITDKEVLHRSDIHFTPLKDHNIIDTVAVVRIVEKEYKDAGLCPEEIDTGAVIITGETAKKENAKNMLESMAGLAGDFVVATAGVNLESILAGKGSGASAYSKERHRVTLNMDIGGGTSNIGVFREGNTIDTACLNIGGHLIELERERDKIIYIAEPARAILRECGLPLVVGERVELETLKTVGLTMARSLVEAISKKELSSITKELLMTAPLRLDYPVERVMISGGVADYVYSDFKPMSVSQVSQWGDMGPLLGWAVGEELKRAGIEPVRPGETIRATVIGAGTHSVNLSGSTISVKEETLPMRNVTVVSPFIGGMPEEVNEIARKVEETVGRVTADGGGENLAIAMEGPAEPSFKAIQKLAEGLVIGAGEYLKDGKPLVLVLQKDCAKVLGQCLGVLLGEDREIVCIDQIRVDEGDYIDIGKPLMGGRVVPVVVKTLVFESSVKS